MIIIQILAIAAVTTSLALLLFAWFTYRANEKSWQDYQDRDLGEVKRGPKPW